MYVCIRIFCLYFQRDIYLYVCSKHCKMSAQCPCSPFFLPEYELSSEICSMHPTCLHGPSVQSLSRVQLFAAPQTVAYQAPLSMGFSRQQYWSELPFPSPGDLPNPGLEPRSPTLQTDTLPSEPKQWYNLCQRMLCLCSFLGVLWCLVLYLSL